MSEIRALKLIHKTNTILYLNLSCALEKNKAEKDKSTQRKECT